MKKKTIEKISKTKNAISRQKIIDGFRHNDLPEQNDNKLAIPTHRKYNSMTFDEYTSHIEQGKTIAELNCITSKHLVSFYTALAKGRITITKDEFETLYDNGMSINEIAKTKGIPRGHMTYLREYYGIKRKGATYIRRLANERPLSQEAKDVIIGSLLGDGHITKWGYFSEKHSPKQLEYLQWKASFFPHITRDKSWSYYEAIDKRSGSLIQTHSFRTTTHSWLQEMEKLWYKKVDGKRIKVVPDQIIEWMNEQVLAVWFMDDGSTDWMYRKGKKLSPGANPACKLSTESFTSKEQELLREVLSSLGLTSYVYYKDKDPNKPNIKFSTQYSIKLIDIVLPFVHVNLLYKVNRKAYLELVHNRLIDSLH